MGTIVTALETTAFMRHCMVQLFYWLEINSRPYSVELQGAATIFCRICAFCCLIASVFSSTFFEWPLSRLDVVTMKRVGLFTLFSLGGSGSRALIGSPKFSGDRQLSSRPGETSMH
jgi:hypothetical protein